MEERERQGMRGAIKVYLDKDEYYPFMTTRADETFGVEVKVDEETLRRWWRVMDEFDRVQDEMYEAYEAGRGGK